MKDGRDERVTEALRSAVPPPPLDSVDWLALQARIGARAAPLLAGAGPPTPWNALAGWAGRAVPLTAAAAAAALLLLSAGPERASQGGTLAFHTIEEELAGDVAAGTAPALVANVSDDELLDALLFYEREDR